jgi:hypothetical protein
MIKSLIGNSARVLGAALLVCAAACSSSSTNEAPKGETGLVLPQGIVPFKNASAAVDAGIYPGSETTCCFLAPKAHLTLDKPAGAPHVTFDFYAPAVGSYFDGETVTVDVGGTSASGSLKKGPRRWIVVSVALPPSYRDQTSVPVTITASKSIVPSKLGINKDPRNLSVILTKVEYP